MNESFKDMIAEGWLVVYMDDLLISSPNAEVDMQRTTKVLQRMKELDLVAVATGLPNLGAHVM